MSNSTDWIREGATVAEFTYGNPDSVTFGTVTRFTATQIVLDNERRYRRDNLRPVGEKTGRMHSGWTELKPVDDTRVRNTAAEQAIRRLHQAIDRVGRAHRDRPRGEAGALIALDEIEQAVRATRKAIAGKEA